MRLARLVILLVAVAIVVLPAGVALAYPPANPVRALPATVEKGETFNVTVHFTAPADYFNSISVTDFAPAGWNVAVNVNWCQPKAKNVLATDNMAEITWWGPYNNGTDFTVLYKVTVPCNTSLGNYTFYDYDGLKYHIANSSMIDEDITGDSNITVVPPAIRSPASIEFYAVYNGTSPPNQTLELWSSTPCLLNWSLSDDGCPWLNETPKNGNCTDVPSPVVLSVNSSGMSLGNYSANITIQSPDANNSPRIVPVTLQVTTTAILKGQVSFFRVEPKGDPTWETGLVVKGFAPGNLNNELWSENATTNNTGFFTIDDVYPGIYDVGIKNATCLSVLNTSVAFTVANVTVVDFGGVLEGDAKETDKIDGFDFAVASGAYNSRPGDENWNANADFNRSGKVDGFDFAVLSGNYNARGDAYGYF